MHILKMDQARLSQERDEQLTETLDMITLVASVSASHIRRSRTSPMADGGCRY